MYVPMFQKLNTHNKAFLQNHKQERSRNNNVISIILYNSNNNVNNDVITVIVR